MISIWGEQTSVLEEKNIQANTSKFCYNLSETISEDEGAYAYELASWQKFHRWYGLIFEVDQHIQTDSIWTKLIQKDEGNI